MEIENPFVFQTDAEIVLSVYNNNPNYIIEYDNNANKEYCILYFSSNNIYFPNSQTEFEQQIVKKNKYEWYGTRVQYGYKHIFIRDIMKQWYLTGINSVINTPEKLYEFLKEQTAGFKVIALGSSAGGFAAVMYGQRLGANRIFSFNGQFEVLSLLQTSSNSIDPILFRNRQNKELISFYDNRNFITNPASVNYFYSNNSQYDVQQRETVRGFEINSIEFKTSHHGVPFLKSNLPVVLHLNEKKLKLLNGKKFHPISFSIRTAGVLNTIKGLFRTSLLILKRIRNKFKNSKG